MKYLKILFIVLAISLLSVNAIAKEEVGEGPKLVIQNLTNETYLVMLYWIDHPFLKETLGRPFNTVGAEMKPGESFNATYKMGIGKFYVEAWKLRTTNKQISKFFTVKPGNYELMICISDGSMGPIIGILRSNTFLLKTN